MAVRGGEERGELDDVGRRRAGWPAVLRPAPPAARPIPTPATAPPRRRRRGAAPARRCARVSRRAGCTDRPPRSPRAPDRRCRRRCRRGGPGRRRAPRRGCRPAGRRPRWPTAAAATPAAAGCAGCRAAWSRRISRSRSVSRLSICTSPCVALISSPSPNTAIARSNAPAAPVWTWIRRPSLHSNIRSSSRLLPNCRSPVALLRLIALPALSLYQFIGYSASAPSSIDTSTWSPAPDDDPAAHAGEDADRRRAAPSSSRSPGGRGRSAPRGCRPTR